MSQSPDTSAPIARREPGYSHVVADMWIGPMSPTLPHRFQSVLTLGSTPGTVPDTVHHRHIPLSYQHLDEGQLPTCISWVLDQLRAERVVLIRSERGRQRPGLIAGMVILRLGGYMTDATMCVHMADPNALTDFRYLNILRASADLVHAKRRRP